VYLSTSIGSPAQPSEATIRIHHHQKRGEGNIRRKLYHFFFPHSVPLLIPLDSLLYKIQPKWIKCGKIRGAMMPEPGLVLGGLSASID